ncbi:hypothetical protein BaRGS_00039154 [Batillaria attramentaria]|uniref:Immunoglobulin subtype domain-containing protein n=1 Tax=Batillaria attramentaria TaxID=370345 RepID=A0ABD0J4V2_9CAEN
MATLMLETARMASIRRWSEVMRGDVLLVILVVMATVSVSEGLTLTQCVDGCLHIQDGTMNNVTCEGFPVNRTVKWEIFYQGTSPFYGTCRPSVDPGPCTSHNNGFTLSVEQPGNVSVLTIDLENFQRNLTDHEVICFSDGKRADCTMSYSVDTTSTSYYTDSSSFSTPAEIAEEGDTNMPAAIAGGIVSFVVVVLVVIAVVYIVYRKRKASAYDHPQPRVNQEYSPYTGLSVSRDATGQHTQHDYVNMATPEHNTSSSTADNHATDGAMHNNYESLQIGQDNDANTYNSLQITSK